MVYLKKLTLTALALGAAEKYSKRTAFDVYRDGYTYNRITYGEFGVRVRRLGSLLMGLGLKAGDRVMLLAENRPGWPVCYFAAARAGLVTVPALVDFIPEQIKTIAVHAGVSALCITERTAAKINEAGIDPAIPRIYIDRVGEGEAGETARSGTAPETEAPFPDTREEDPAVIIYTSGTTGNSKGVVLSNRNLLSNALAARSLMRIFPRDRLLSVIPLAHTYECTLGLLSAVMNGAVTTYLDRPPSPKVLLPALQALRPTAMLTVPLFIEKIYRHHIRPALLKHPLYRFPPTRPLAIASAGRKLLGVFGGAIRFYGIGGAPLPADTEDFLRKVQFPYAPGYGLTETSPLVAGTAPYRFPFRSAGQVLKGIEVRIAGAAPEGAWAGSAWAGSAWAGSALASSAWAEGEIQVRGPNVMMGYYRNEEMTRAAFTSDGWLKTGDLGYLDRKGRLYVRGRLKAMILGPSGENIYPEDIEGLLTASEIVEEALVYPGGRGELIALIVLSERARTMLAALGDSLEELKNRVNKRLAAFSRLNRIEVREEPFEKTATAKIKRFLYSPDQP
ncbi:MAG: AMP-binding protein [Treponema sp.]|jgi:long-chain acyl-CoA synthetase|nr:AMP-binding protein [Treponema sp.]